MTVPADFVFPADIEKVSEEDLVTMPVLRPGKDRKYVLTCRTVHLTYPIHFRAGPMGLATHLIDTLQKYGTLPTISAVEETGLCRLIGYECPHTHIAIDIGSSNLRINGLAPFIFERETPHVRLVKMPGHWRYIFNEYHHKEKPPLQRTNGGHLKYAEPRQPKLSATAAARASHSTKSLNAYNEAMHLNTLHIQELVTTENPCTKGGLNWFTNMHNAVLLADHLHLNGKALAFQGRWEMDHIADTLQQAANRGYRPPMVIITIMVGAGQPPTPDQLSGLYRVCEHIRDGRLYSRRPPPPGTHNIPIADWHPTVHVYADFYPAIYDPNFAFDRWTISLPDPEGHTGHLICGSQNHVAGQYAVATSNPQPNLISLNGLRSALTQYDGAQNPDAQPLPGYLAIRTPAEAAAAFFHLFSNQVLRNYYTAGYCPYVKLVRMDIHIDSLGTMYFDPNGDGDEQLIATSTELSKAGPGSLSGHYRIGKVIICAQKLTPEKQKRAIESLDDPTAMEIVRYCSHLGQRGYDVPEDLPPIQGANFDRRYIQYELDPPTPARIPTPDPTPAPHETVLAYLSGLDGLKITLNASIPPVSGEATTYTIQCLVVYSTDRVAVIEIDEAPPSSLDVYRTLLALHRGAKIIRLRAPDIRLATFNWKEAIRNAIHGTGMIHLLQPPGQDYWRPTFDTIVQWRTRHPTEWRDHCHKSTRPVAVKK
jgi:hypothetical protein